MNTGGILILVLCFQGIFSVLTNKKSEFSTLHHYHSRRLQLQGYPKAILNELNEYRRQKIFSPEIEWQNNLANTAAQEAFALNNNEDTIDDHNNFNKWSQSYEGFTEITVNYHTQDRASRHAFASGVVQALIDKYRANLVQNYKYCGIAIRPDKKNHNKYIVVLHLAASGHGKSQNLKDLKKLKDATVDDTIRTYKSCLEALEKKETKDWIKTPDGKTIKCDQKFDHGGWSRVLDSDWKGSAVMGIIPIDDRDIKFKEVLFRAKDNYIFYATGRNDIYVWDGYSFRFNALRFGKTWYVDKRSTNYARYTANGFRQFNFSPSRSNIKTYKKATLCKFSNQQNLNDCGKIFKFIKFPPGKLYAFGDIESTTGRWFQDNRFQYFFELFVR